MAKRKTTPEEKMVGLTLSNIDIDFHLIEAKQESEATFHYDIWIEEPEVLPDGVIFFETNVVVRKTVPGIEYDVVRVSAQYYCGVGANSPRKEMQTSTAIRYAKTAVWTAFTSLSAVIASQMHIHVPYLPVAPTQVRVQSVSAPP